eukprot:Plantae.Rhodophyta-Hildenbrandia_rubra.ctg44164.p1 GENE.Plantae.Rhodophyta-Hildenbrandia_rubra.ctg44164~~Plantae.Rhodophyta-Hildenbrandia_rubra.ctg44164.p1  ORF type:complete len:366 (-),score=61.41 Plantae.Rhodophyta-Hildenbrandia_rubra.ctg44164:227-1324(-)
MTSHNNSNLRQRRGNNNELFRAVTSASAVLQTLTFRQKMIAGAIARGIAQSILHPVDVVRTRVQAINVSGGWTLGTFLRGISPQIVLALPAGAVQFAAFEGIKEWLRDRGFHGDGVTLFAGAGGAGAAALFRVPQEVLKQPIQAGIYKNIFEAIQGVVGKNGVRGLYTGWMATISRDIPWNALSFMFHAQGKKLFYKVKGRMPENDENLVVAGIAGAVAAVIMTPVDVVKTRLMTQRVDVAKQYVGIVNTFVSIVKNEGPKTLMKGVVPRIVYLAPLAGITISVYEAVVRTFIKRGNSLPVARKDARKKYGSYQQASADSQVEKKAERIFGYPSGMKNQSRVSALSTAFVGPIMHSGLRRKKLIL